MKHIILVMILMVGILPGAAVAIEDDEPATCATTPGFQRLDFWVGDWDVFGPGGQQAGTNRIEKISNGCALLENWVGITTL